MCQNWHNNFYCQHVDKATTAASDALLLAELPAPARSANKELQQLSRVHNRRQTTKEAVL
jgi:hypothetical protein